MDKRKGSISRAMGNHRLGWPMLCLLLTVGVGLVEARPRTPIPFTTPEANAKKESGSVKLHTQSVELVEVKPSAEKCQNAKDGTTIRLKVTSESPVDVRLYAQFGYKQWVEKDFPHQKPGDEILDYMCRPKTQYKVYARPAGSKESWPKP